jgi:LysR family transcriptional regulator for bpeEF and oprC
MHTTIHAMNIFVRAVEQNSFVGAARSLLIDPTAVSRTISALEKELGVLLFARSTRTLKLTVEGARFYRDCIQILQKFTEATQRFRADGAMPYGPLKIGIAPGLRRRLLLRVIPRFLQQYPQIEIVLVSVDDRADIGNKGVDVLIRARSLRQRGGARPEPQGLVVRKLFQSRYIACASQEYLDRAGSPRTPADLLQHACVAHLSLEYDVADEWRFAQSDERQKVKFVPKLRIQGADALCEAGVAGCGIVRLLAANIEDELRSRTLVPVLSDWECAGEMPMLAIYRKTRPIVPQVSVFIRYLADAFRRYNLPPNTGPRGR